MRRRAYVGAEGVRADDSGRGRSSLLRVRPPEDGSAAAWPAHAFIATEPAAEKVASLRRRRSGGYRRPMLLQCTFPAGGLQGGHERCRFRRPSRSRMCSTGSSRRSTSCRPSSGSPPGTPTRSCACSTARCGAAHRHVPLLEGEAATRRQRQWTGAASSSTASSASTTSATHPTAPGSTCLTPARSRRSSTASSA